MEERSVWIGSLSAIATFFLVWIGVSLSYGFLGFALGWLPAIIVAALVGIFMTFAWKVVAFLIAALIAVIVYFGMTAN